MKAYFPIVEKEYISITSGYRADYTYRCTLYSNGRLYKRLLYCRPRDGFQLYKVYYEFQIGSKWFSALPSYFFAKDEQDALHQQRVLEPRYRLRRAEVVKDAHERKQVYECAYRMP